MRLVTSNSEVDPLASVERAESSRSKLLLGIPNLSQKNVKPHKQRGKLFKKIQQHYSQTKQLAVSSLEAEEAKITRDETVLSNLSLKFRETWKIIQRKVLFLSLLRISLKETRRFGILPKTKRKKKATHIPQEPVARVVDPDSKLFQLHEWILFLTFLYLLVAYPLEFLYYRSDESSPVQLVDYVVCAYLLVDVVLRFITPVNITFSDITAVSVRQTAAAYLKSSCWLDVLGSLPIDLSLLRFSLTARRCFLVLRLVRVGNTVLRNSHYTHPMASKLKSLFGSGRSLPVYSLIASTFFFVHICSCIWILLLEFEDEFNWYSR